MAPRQLMVAGGGGGVKCGNWSCGRVIDIEGPLGYFRISLIGGIHIDARALLLDVKLIWFDYIGHLFQ